MITMKAYIDVNGEIVYVQEGSFQELDSIAGGLTPVPALDYVVSADLLSNVTLDNKLDDSQLIDDDSMATATATNIPSAESVKAYVDAQISSNDDASEISYDGSTSGLVATDVQGAVDELDGRLDTAETDITELEANQADLIALSGVPENSSDLGTFTGTTISDTQTIKGALQQLETFAENISNTIRVTDVSVVADVPARDALTADEGDVAKVLDADGNGNPETFIYDGAAWVSLKSDDSVDSVNGQVGTILLDTDDINEGTSNLYHTDARAKAAAVVNTLAGTETDQAPSVAAVNAALAAQDDASEITVTPAGNLASTDVQSALQELQGGIDTLSSVAKEYVYANQTVAQTGINGTPVSVIFDNEAKNSNGSVFTVNTTTGEITVNKTGTFKVEYVMTADTNDGARRTSETTLQIDTGSGFAALSASLGSTTAFGYHRNNASGENSAASQAILDLTSGDKLRLRLRRSNGSGTINTIPQGTSISIEEK